MTVLVAHSDPLADCGGDSEGLRDALPDGDAYRDSLLDALSVSESVLELVASVADAGPDAVPYAVAVPNTDGDTVVLEDVDGFSDGNGEPVG